MSFFDKVKSGLKSVSDRVTGDYGSVALELKRDTFEIGEEIEAHIQLVAKGDLKVTKVLLMLEGIEKLDVDEDLENDERAKATTSTITHQTEIEVLGETELPAGTNRWLTANLAIPAEVYPSCQGRHFQYSWRCKVRVDVPWGVDLWDETEITLTHTAPWEQEAVEDISGSGSELKVGAKIYAGDIGLETGCISLAAMVQGLTQTVAEQFAVELRMVETIECTVTRGQGEEATRETRWVPFVVGRSQRVLQKSLALEPGEAKLSMGTLRFPEEAGLTYSGERARAQLIYVAEGRSSTGETVTAEYEFTVKNRRQPKPEPPAPGYRATEGGILFRDGFKEVTLPGELYAPPKMMAPPGEVTPPGPRTSLLEAFQSFLTAGMNHLLGELPAEGLAEFLDPDLSEEQRAEMLDRDEWARIRAKLGATGFMPFRVEGYFGHEEVYLLFGQLPRSDWFFRRVDGQFKRTQVDTQEAPFSIALPALRAGHLDAVSPTEMVNQILAQVEAGTLSKKEGQAKIHELGRIYRIPGLSPPAGYTQTSGGYPPVGGGYPPQPPQS